jgi:hypothetical protein
VVRARNETWRSKNPARIDEKGEGKGKIEEKEETLKAISRKSSIQLQIIRLEDRRYSRWLEDKVNARSQLLRQARLRRDPRILVDWTAALVCREPGTSWRKDFELFIASRIEAEPVQGVEYASRV